MGRLTPKFRNTRAALASSTSGARIAHGYATLPERERGLGGDRLHRRVRCPRRRETTPVIRLGGDPDCEPLALGPAADRDRCPSATGEILDPPPGRLRHGSDVREDDRAIRPGQGVAEG